MRRRELRLKELVERALQRELAARRDLRPHAQLAIPATATAEEIDRAYARLRRQYETLSIADYGPAAVAAANGIAALLRAAHEAMRQPLRPDGSEGHEPAEALPALEPRPRRDETCRALETLRAAIARRLAEADTHRRAGRRPEAMRALESVLLLDRGNEQASRWLREVRALEPRRPSALSRMIRRVFRRARGQGHRETEAQLPLAERAAAATAPPPT
jgi:hypothetical protein